MEKKKIKKDSISSTAITAIVAGKNNHEVLKLVKRIHSGCRTTIASISWYRSRIKKNGKKNRAPLKTGSFSMSTLVSH